MKKSNIINIEEKRINKFKRNIYHFPNINERFIIVNREIIDLKLSVELKGFLIQLFTLVLNGTYECNLKQTEIVERIKVSKNSYYKYMKELINEKLIIKTENGFKISSTYFNIGKTRQEKEVAIVKQMIVGNSKLEKIDWMKYKYPILALYHITGKNNYSEIEKEKALTEITL